MDWKEFYFSPKGRINRKLFWLGPNNLESWFLGLNLITLGIFGLLSLILVYIPIIKHYKELSTKIEPIILLFPIVNLIYIRAVVHIKRLHDLDKSGWIYLIGIILSAFLPLLYLIYILYVGVFKGTEGENHFGEDPLLANRE
ncbi:putative membrane protein [Thiovulum sp. ES]|nr:putative membrane protein [Thiovulum sp. ES]